MSLLTMIQAVCNRTGITSPSSVVGNVDLNITRMLGYANEEGQELAARWAWRAIMQEATFTTVATASQGALTTITGTDFNYIVPETFWNRTQRRPVFGPCTDQQWEQMQAQQINGPWNQYIIRAGSIYFVPIPAAGQSCYFNWISKNWCQIPASTTYASWNADTNVGLLDERVMGLGVTWRWKAAQGFDYAEDFVKYEQAVSDAIARDGVKPRLNLGASQFDVWPAVIVPSGSWSLP